MAKYDYKCVDCGAIIEVVKSISEYNKPYCCPDCGTECVKVFLNMNFSLDPISGDHVSATNKWIKHRERTIAKERREKRDHIGED